MHDLSVPILMYHSISESANPLFAEWAVPPEMFDAHLSYLVESGYTPITVSDLVNARRGGGTTPLRPVVLTFDDAYADFYENAYPILRQHGAPATLYVPTAHVGANCAWLREDGESWRRMATWSQLAEMSAHGIECGGHSHTHVQLDTLSGVEANREIRQSKRLLDAHLGRPALSFAYPHGWNSALVRRLVQAAGYTSACAVKNMRSAPDDDPFALGRLHVHGDMDVEALAGLLARANSPLEVTLRGVARTVIRFGPRSQARMAQMRALRHDLPRTLPAVAEEAQAGAGAPLAVDSSSPAPAPPTPNAFQPALMLDIELSQPLEAVEAETRADGARYTRGLALVRLHTQPVGLLELAFGETGLAAGELASRIWEALGPQINAHLAADGMARVDALTAIGVGAADEPRCLAPRRAFLARAPFVSVVIPTHNRPQQVMALVESVLASEYPADRFETLVVDNAPSTNETALLFNQGYEDSARVRYLREDRAGSSHARNCGLAQARGELVVFADDDELVDRYWLGEMARGFEAAADVWCVTGLVAPMELETQAQGWFEQFGGYCKEGFAGRLFNLTDHRGDSPLYPYNVGAFGAGGSMAFRRERLLEMGGFDPALGPATPTMGGEDVDAMLRVVLAGHTLAYMPSAIVRHPSHREYERLRGQLRGYGYGLSAVLFKTLVTQPRWALDFLLKAPRGLVFAFGADSGHHASKQVDYPEELTRLERRGLLAGPLAYLRSRRRLAAAAARSRTLDYIRTQTARALDASQLRQENPASLPAPVAPQVTHGIQEQRAGSAQ